MDTFTIEWKRAAEKELRQISSTEIPKMVEVIESLAQNPFPVGHRKLVGSENLYRIRVGDYRVIYEVCVATKLITIEHIRHRKDAYRDL